MANETILNPFVPGMFNGQPKALLVLYSHRHYDTQLIRPYAYGFSDKTIDLLMNKGDTMSAALSRPDVASNPDIATAIRPDDGMNSVKMDMSVYSNLWTFVLMIVQPNNYNGAAMSSMGNRTMILTGHCIGEPANEFTLAMSTPTMNPNCQLVVQNRQVLSNGMQGSAFGMTPNTSVMWNDDIIDPSLNMAAANRDLYIMTPDRVLSNYDYSGTEMSSICTSGTCSVASNDRQPIQATLKTPGIHLRQIVESLDSQTREAKMSEYSPHGISNSPGVLTPLEDVDQFKSGVAAKLTSASAASIIQSGGIDALSVFTLQELSNAYPNLDVQFQKFTTNMPQYEVTPQTIANPKVAYSAFISSAISSLASDVGLNKIDFMYTSYDPAKRNCAEKHTYQVADALLTCPPQDQHQYNLALAGAVESFKTLFHTQVAPFITGVVGNFMVTGRYVGNGETLVDLQLLDYGSNTNLSGWYETPNRLGNFASTTLGSAKAFENNGFSLNAFVLKTQGKSEFISTGLAPVATPSFDEPVVIPNPSGFGTF